MPATSLDSLLLARRKPKHVGFLNYSRRTLAVGAIAACAVMTGIQALPASAEVVHEEVVVSNFQSYAAPAAVVLPAVVRDAFGTSVFTVMQWPVPSSTKMSSDFGYRSCAGCSSDHQGIDLNPGEGFPIEAIGNGVVTEVGNPSGALGVYVMIEHMVDGGAVTSVYAHMQYGSMNLGVGDRVSMGQQIGRVGDTGLSTGPHLHFGIQIDGEFIDPLPWILAHANTPY